MKIQQAIVNCIANSDSALQAELYNAIEDYAERYPRAFKHLQKAPFVADLFDRLSETLDLRIAL